jgi:23S rRNA pseudouridine1911/1915/1917 synthase
VEFESDRSLRFYISGNQAGERVDSFLASQINDLTRSRVKELIKAGFVTVNDGSAKASYALKTGDRIGLVIPPPEESRLEPEKVDFSIVYEDQTLIVIDKPAGVVVHPAPGHSSGTLVHGLLEHCGDLSGIGGVLRPGIVHRLDKGTSGLMVVAKNDKAHEALAGQFKKGGVKKEYLALVHEAPRAPKGKIDLPIGRHPIHRKRMAVVRVAGKQALTLWEVKDRYRNKFALLQINLKTGRTHQIRVHLSHMGYPVVGDPVYGPKRVWWKKNFPGVNKIHEVLVRQMLHAGRLAFVHPEKGELCKFETPIPEDMAGVMVALKRLVAVDNNP